MKQLESITKQGAIYVPPLFGSVINTAIKQELLGLEWLTKKTARHEYFMSDKDREYSYGNKGTGDETYTSKPFTPHVDLTRLVLNGWYGTEFNVCFLNKYDDQHQHLQWHADQFDGMREDQPIFVMSFGAEREIWVKDKRGFPCPVCAEEKAQHDKTFAELVAKGKEWSQYMRVGCKNKDCEGDGWLKSPPNGKQPEDHRFSLEESSLFIMPAGYQDTHLHRIPKHSQPCGYRISLTFRSFK